MQAKRTMWLGRALCRLCELFRRNFLLKTSRSRGTFRLADFLCGPLQRTHFVTHHNTLFPCTECVIFLS